MAIDVLAPTLGPMLETARLILRLDMSAAETDELVMVGTLDLKFCATS